VGIGFERVAPRRWVRSTKAPIRELFDFVTLKTDRIGPRWGISLDFVPHLDRAGRVKWHRTARSAVHDLCHDPLDYVSPTSRHVIAWTLYPNWPLSFRKEAAPLAGRALQEAHSFWNGITDLPGVLRRIEEKKAQSFVRFGFSNYTQEPLAEAFVRSALGQDIAGDLLNAYLVRLDVSEAVDATLRERLASVRLSPDGSGPAGGPAD
jgi:hypothetical protein